MRIGACNLMVCPIHVFKDIDAAALVALQSSAAAELRAVGVAHVTNHVTDSGLGNGTEGGGTIVYLDCGAGDDVGAGTETAPLKTVAAAQKASRAAGAGSTVPGWRPASPPPHHHDDHHLRRRHTPPPSRPPRHHDHRPSTVTSLWLLLWL